MIFTYSLHIIELLFVLGLQRFHKMLVELQSLLSSTIIDNLPFIIALDQLVQHHKISINNGKETFLKFFDKNMIFFVFYNCYLHRCTYPFLQMDWINKYHEKVIENIGTTEFQNRNPEAYRWLESRTRKITRTVNFSAVMSPSVLLIIVAIISQIL